MVLSSFVVFDPSSFNFSFPHPLGDPALAELLGQGVD
jgi:hypothetical protein